MYSDSAYHSQRWLQGRPAICCTDRMTARCGHHYQQVVLPVPPQLQPTAPPAFNQDTCAMTHPISPAC